MIHEFRNNHWLPGPDRRDGSRPFPAHPTPGLFFNDVTGAEGPTADAVAEGLPQLLMKQGALADLLPGRPDWLGFMSRLETAAKRFDEPDREFAQVFINPDETAVVMPAAEWGMPLAQEGGQLALALVRANGQMDFIRRQPWFHAGTHRVVLVLEQQFWRTTPHLQFHQDTTGDALFSNLIFRNDAGLPAPEWSPNLQPMPADKRALVSRQWPSELLTRIDNERERLAASMDRLPPIAGGTLPADAYVSWTDELVWHTTPILEHREHHSLQEVVEVLADDEFDMVTYDVLVHIAQTPDTSLANRLALQGMALTDFSEQYARDVWAELHAGPPGQALLAQLRQDARRIDWDQCTLDTAWAMPLIRTLPDGTQQIGTQPSGMNGRPRRNSEHMATLLADPASTQQRNFMQVVVAVQAIH